MEKVYSWYEVLNEKTGEVEKYRDPLNPDAFPDDEKNIEKRTGITENSEQKTNINE